MDSSPCSSQQDKEPGLVGLIDVSSCGTEEKNTVVNRHSAQQSQIQFYGGLDPAPVDSQQCDVACKIQRLFQDSGPVRVSCCLGK